MKEEDRDEMIKKGNAHNTPTSLEFLVKIFGWVYQRTRSPFFFPAHSWTLF